MADTRSKTIVPFWLHPVLDGAPVICFLAVALITRNLQLATWFVVGGAALSLLVSLVIERRVRPLPTVTGALALIFGGLSLALHRNDIIQMKMTIVDGLLGAALLVGLALKKNPLKAVLGQAVRLGDRHWNTLAVRYGLFFWACAVANEIVRRTQSDYVWTKFRIAVIVLTVVFALSQMPFLMKHAEDSEADDPQNDGQPSP